MARFWGFRVWGTGQVLKPDTSLVHMVRQTILARWSWIRARANPNQASAWDMVCNSMTQLVDGRILIKGNTLTYQFAGDR
jgi:hypothetical protein